MPARNCIHFFHFFFFDLLVRPNHIYHANEERTVTGDSDLPKKLAHWGRQTIAFASLRAQDDGQPLDDASQVGHAEKATEKITAELWDEAFKECKVPTEIVMRFARKVLDWVQEHRDSRSK